MKIKITTATRLKGKGAVNVGDSFTDKDADPVELHRLVAYHKAIIVDTEPQSKAKESENKPKVDLTKGLNTKTAAGLK